MRNNTTKDGPEGRNPDWPARDIPERFPILSADRAAAAMVQTLRLCQLHWKAGGKRGRERLLDLQQMSMRLLIRELGPDLLPVQMQELEFQWDLREGLEMRWRHAWRAEMAYPAMQELRRKGAVQPYEAGLIYLLFEQLAIKPEPDWLHRQVLDLQRSWRLTSWGGSAYFSRLLFRTALRLSQWLKPLSREPEAQSRTLIFSLLGLLSGASRVSVERDEHDWHRVVLAALVESIWMSLPMMPGMSARLYDRCGSTERQKTPPTQRSISGVAGSDRGAIPIHSSNRRAIRKLRRIRKRPLRPADRGRGDGVPGLGG